GPVPVDRPPQAFLEAVARLPTQRAHPTGLERVAVIVAGPVGDEPLEGWRLGAQPQDMVRDLVPADLRAAPQVVARARRSLPLDTGDALDVVLHVEVVADGGALAVDGERQVLEGVGDEKGDDLLGEL